MKSIKFYIQTFLSFSIIFLLVIGVWWGSNILPTYAETSASAQANYEQENIMDDLEGSTINGRLFDINDYPRDLSEDLKVLSFVEFGYSYYTSTQSDFALYVYIYNPRHIPFDYDSSLNEITFRVGGLTSADYNSYPLTFLNMSESSDIRGRFLKYKIELSDSEKQSILNALDHSSRVYEVTEVELAPDSGSAIAYDVSSKYTYTGYAAGYGINVDDEATLSCVVSGDVLSFSPEVHHTFFRAEGNNGTNSYTQDTLYSVYFSVPNNLLDTYGEIVEIRASWLKAMTQWAFVTGNQVFYDLIEQYMGYDMSNGENTMLPLESPNFSDISDYRIYAQDYDKNVVFDYGQVGDIDSVVQGYTEYDGWFSGLFYAGSDTDSADSYVISSEILLSSMIGYHDEYDIKEDLVLDQTPANPQPGWYYGSYVFSTPYDGAYLEVDGKEYSYSKALFESWDSEETVADIAADDELPSLHSVTLGKTFWEKLFGGYHEVSSTTYDNINAIEKISEDSFLSTVSATCSNLYIDESDYEDFRLFYEEATAKDETVYLFRFDVGEYSALETVLGTTNDSGLVTPDIDVISTNGRIFKQNVYLDFDLIHLKLLSGDTVTTIGVVMSPIDIIADSTPALDVNSDRSVLKSLLLILGLILLLVILMPVLPYIVRFVVWLIGLPFKLISAIAGSKNKQYNNTGQADSDDRHNYK